MSTVCKFNLPIDINREIVESQLAVAIIKAECEYGQPEVRKDAAYCVSMERPQVVIDISSRVGKYITQIFLQSIIYQIDDE